MSVVALPEVRRYLRELVGTLHAKGYFGLEESALRYVGARSGMCFSRCMTTAARHSF
jgi:hypothetical protein